MSTIRLTKNVYDKKCDLADCSGSAEVCITFPECGPAANIDICKNCLQQVIRQGKRFVNERKY